MRLLRTSAALLVLSFLAACSDDSPTAPTPTPGITLTGNLSFGTVTVGTSATATLTIANTGTGDLNISSVTYPVGFSGSFTVGTIAANASQAVTVTFAPTQAQGYSGNITVTGNQQGGTTTVAVSGTGGALASFTLSGIVTETAPTTTTVLAGARLTFVDGENLGKTGTTGADGRYQITGVVNGGYTVRAELAGYTTVLLPVGINGNTTLDVRLAPTGPRTSFGPGQYRVGTDMPAGRYYNDPVNGCRYQRVSGFGGTPSEVIFDRVIDFDAGQWIVDVVSTDAGFVTDANCGTWFTTPRRGLQTTLTAGRWIVGAQITPGTFRAENAVQGCYWERLSNFTGAANAIIANQFVTGPGAQLVTIAATDAGFTTTPECGSWVRQ